MIQNQIFRQGEGDAWFYRNHSHFQAVEKIKQSPDVRYLLESLASFRNRIERVLEIGCSNGIKLEAICDSLNAIGVGVEPSSNAVTAGNNRKKISEISLQVGTGEELPCHDASFDLVYFAFCLYLFDRNTLMQSLAEADRVLKPGGFLVITDFDPGSLYKRPYNHREGVFSYKQDYSAFYTQSGLYYILGKHSFSHRKQSFDEAPDERVSTSILYKEIDPYPTRG
jgi:ubiquinone/menaquinone biosynthesis C-methylase UbiE